MTSRGEKERQKAQQEKFQAVLSSLLKDDDNKYCVDCDGKGPRWASWNLGIFMCIRCAGIHRNLGVHISKVKSVNLDQWTAEQIAMVMEMGNSRARAVYEANLPDNYRRPQTDSALESFIRAKYEHKKYIAREWVPPKPSIPKELLEDDRDKKKSRPKPSGNIQLSTPTSRTPTAAVTTTQTTTPSKPSPKPAHTTPKPVEPQQPKAPPPSSNTADLIGLVFAQPVSNDIDAPEAPPQNGSNSLLNDFMGQNIAQEPTTSSQNNVNQVSNDSIEAKLFDDTTTMSPESSGQKPTTKDSIMALYGGQQKQQQFGVPAPDWQQTYIVPGPVPTEYILAQTGGVYMPQQQNPGMYNNPQQANIPMQQAAGYGNQMGMMGTPAMAQTSMNPAQMGMQPGMMGMPQGNMGMPQASMGMPQGNMAMYGQQMQFQQMQNQMAGLRVGQQAQMVAGGVQNGVPAGQGEWGAAPNGGQTLSTNLWQ